MYNPTTNNASLNQAVIKDSLLLVQSAVDNYKKNNGVLPIKNFDSQTPLYEQCVVDFKKIMDQGLLGEIPTNAYEKGGSNYYVIVTPETKPTVKLLDLISIQQVNEVQSKITEYRNKHFGQIPSKQQTSIGWFTIDYAKLHMTKPTVLSPYSRLPIELFVALDGTVVMDYGSDIMKALQMQHVNHPSDTVDLRTFLVAASYYVPAKSGIYYWMHNEPVLQRP
jgi:hypothetical protein